MDVLLAATNDIYITQKITFKIEHMKNLYKTLRTTRAALVVLLMGIFLLMTITGQAQITGDYQSIATGNWNAAGSWQIYTASGWTTTAKYPGETAGDESATVTIQLGHIITAFNGSVSIGDLTIYGQLNMPTTNKPTFSLLTTQNVLVDGGTILFQQNTTAFRLPVNAVLQIVNIDGCPSAPTEGLQGSNNTHRLYIGTVDYAAETGGGNVNFLFDALNCSGGALYVEATATPEEICKGSEITLEGTSFGNGSTDPNVTYSWTGTGPASYTFTFSGKNPSSFILNTPGTYTYTFTAVQPLPGTNGGNYTTSDVVNIIVDPTTVGGTVSGGTTVCYGTNSTALSLTGATGAVLKWQSLTNGGSSWTDIANTNTTFTATNLTATTQFRALV